MAISTSPYQQNNYQAANTFRPYELPINDAFKALVAQDQFWKAGAARVKNVYQDALGLNLSIAANRDVRDNFMKNAEKEIQKLSTMNLADPSVQRQGFGIFKPLMQDEGILYDDLMTRHYEKVRNDALAERENNNGKGYSDINLQYAMDGYEEFVNSQDRMAGKQFYQKKREYTPYYDYTLDYERAMKECKASSITTTSPVYNNGEISGYMKTQSNKFRSAAQTRNCLESGMSSQGLRQLQIEGAVNYKGKPDVLASDTVDYLSGVSANLSDQLQELSTQKYAIQNNKNLTGDAKQAALEQIEQAMKGISGELNQNNLTVSKLNSGDYSPLDENYDAYAGSVYSFRKINKRAAATAFQEQEESYKADPVQLSAIKFQQEQYLRNMDYNFDKSLKQMEIDHDKEMTVLDILYGGKGGSGTRASNGMDFKGKAFIIHPTTGEIIMNPDLQRQSLNITGEPQADTQAYAKLQTEITNLDQSRKDNDISVYNKLIERGNMDEEFRKALLAGFNYGSEEWDKFKANTKGNRFVLASQGNVPGGIQQTTWFKAYHKLHPDDEDMSAWAKRTSDNKLSLDVLNRKVELAEKQVAKELGYNQPVNEIINEKIKGLNSVVINGTRLTPDDVLSALQGNTSKLKIERTPGVNSIAGNNQQVSSGYIPTVYTVNGIKLTREQSMELHKLVNKVQAETFSVNDAVTKKRAEVYGRAGFGRDPWFLTPDTENPIVDQISRLFPDNNGNPNKGVAIEASDFSGGIKIRVPGNFKDAAIKIRNGLGVGTSVEESPDGMVIIRGTNYNVIPQAINNPTMRNAAFQLSTIAETTEFKKAEPGQKVGDDLDVPIWIAGEQRNFLIKTFKDNGAAVYKVFAKNGTTVKPLIVSSNAYDLLQQFAGLNSMLNSK